MGKCFNVLEYIDNYHISGLLDRWLYMYAIAFVHWYHWHKLLNVGQHSVYTNSVMSSWSCCIFLHDWVHVFAVDDAVCNICTVVLASRVSCVVICRWWHCSSDDSPTAEADEVPLIMSEPTGFDTDENEYLMRNRSSRRLHKKSVMYYLCDAWIEACSRSSELFFCASAMPEWQAEVLLCSQVVRPSFCLSVRPFVTSVTKLVNTIFLKTRTDSEANWYKWSMG